LFAFSLSSLTRRSSDPGCRRGDDGGRKTGREAGFPPLTRSSKTESGPGGGQGFAAAVPGGDACKPGFDGGGIGLQPVGRGAVGIDRKSTRLNSSHVKIS